MKILLTGSTGLIGKEVGKLLAAKGHQIVSVSRSAKRAKVQLPFQCEIIEWSGEGDFPNNQLSGIDGVIHLMGESIADHRWTDEVKEKLIKSRVNATQKLVNACDQYATQLKFWIQGSAIGYYGDSKQKCIFDEGSPVGEGFLSELCQQWEGAVASSFKKSNEIRKVYLRTGVVISHQGGALAKMMNPLLAGVGGVIGSGEQRMSVIHLIDLVRFIAHAVEKEDVNGIFNLVSETPVTQRNFIESLSSKLSISAGLSVPKIAIKLALGEMGNLLLQDQAVISKKLEESGFQFHYPQLDEILDEVVQWYKNPLSKNNSKPAHLFYQEQFLPFSRNQLFQFFSDAKNLEKITPKWLNFNIVNMNSGDIHKNTQLKYHLKLHGIPLSWTTDILEWEPPIRFVDNQLSGPYQLWFHDHHFEEVKGGTLMKDWIRFQLPMGKLGMAGLSYVYGDLEKIFAFRAANIEQLLM